MFYGNPTCGDDYDDDDEKEDNDDVDGDDDDDDDEEELSKLFHRSHLLFTWKESGPRAESPGHAATMTITTLTTTMRRQNKRKRKRRRVRSVRGAFYRFHQSYLLFTERNDVA